MRSRSRSRSRERNDRHSDYKRKHNDYSSRDEGTDRNKYNERRSPNTHYEKRPVKEEKKETETDEERDSRTIFVWQLSKRVSESDLRDFFTKAGPLKDVKVIRDQRTNKPKGIAYVEFFSPESVPKAMNFVGTRIKGVPIQINLAVDKPDMNDSAIGVLDNEYADRGGVGLGNTGRLALMAKLAEGTGMELPKNAQEIMKNSLGGAAALSGNHPVSLVGRDKSKTGTEPRVISVGDIINMRRQAHSNAYGGGTSECFMITNMFDNNLSGSPGDFERPTPSFYRELRDDVEEECRKLGRVSQVVVDEKNPGGNVYIRCYGPEDAQRCVNVMNGRYFSGRQLAASIISLGQFHQFSLASR